MSRRDRTESRRYRGAVISAALLVIAAAACTSYVPFDSSGDLDRRLEQRVPEPLRESVEYPFELSQELREAAARRINPSFSEPRRTEAILDFVFGALDLQYALSPTRNASETFASRRGNCLSFVNLFVGLGRENRLNPFYVEVEDYQRWNYQAGVVVSRGHIVAGMYIDGQLSTFDFLPYQAKSYRDFKPIDDLTAMAHFYNNLGAEALMDDRIDEAARVLELAVALAPEFDKAVNNLGVVYLRRGESQRAIELLRRGLESDPDNVPLMSNLARAYQQTGQIEQANELFDRLEKVNKTNPFFYVYRGDMALAGGDMTSALSYMRKAYQTDSNLPEVHLGLVRVYLALGKMTEAQHHVERALKLDATNEEARKFAAMLARGPVPTNG
ncbi:MAG TPA: tetratricopeptide repeat protein [Thermoanaerobaculia bacterium]|nr:tetratricopeptide repeat protein [Thermoanaerobaculia bacterium]